MNPAPVSFPSGEPIEEVDLPAIEKAVSAPALFTEHSKRELEAIEVRRIATREQRGRVVAQIEALSLELDDLDRIAAANDLAMKSIKAVM